MSLLQSPTVRRDRAWECDITGAIHTLHCVSQPLHPNNSIRAGFGTGRRVAGGNWDSGISKNVLQSTPTGSQGLTVNGRLRTSIRTVTPVDRCENKQVFRLRVVRNEDEARRPLESRRRCPCRVGELLWVPGESSRLGFPPPRFNKRLKLED